VVVELALLDQVVVVEVVIFVHQFQFVEIQLIL
jgi:hypothetical protein